MTVRLLEILFIVLAVGVAQWFGEWGNLVGAVVAIIGVGVLEASRWAVSTLDFNGPVNYAYYAEFAPTHLRVLPLEVLSRTEVQSKVLHPDRKNVVKVSVADRLRARWRWRKGIRNDNGVRPSAAPPRDCDPR